MNPTTEQLVSRLALPTAVFATVVGQLHALARHATDDGAEDLEYPLTRAWAVPAAKALRPLLDWADADTVYVTYGKIWFPVFAIFTAAAFVVYRHRRPRGFEKWAFRVALAGYVLATGGVLATYYTPFLDEAFLFLDLPGLALSAFGGTALGIAFLKNRFRPVITSLLLIGFIPLFFAITEVTSMGSAILPLSFGWAFAVRRTAAPEPATPDSSGSMSLAGDSETRTNRG